MRSIYRQTVYRQAGFRTVCLKLDDVVQFLFWATIYSAERDCPAAFFMFRIQPLPLRREQKAQQMRTASVKTPKSRVGRPRREHADQRRDQLLDIATATFIELGYNAATVDGIALAAGVGKQTIYSRYPDKAALFSAVVKRLAERNVLEAISADTALDFEVGLRRHAAACIQTLLRPEAIALYTLLQREGQRFPELGKIFQVGASTQFIEPLADYFRQQRKRGLTRKIDPERAAKLFMHLVLGDINRCLLLSAQFPNTDEIEHYAQEITQLFLHGVSAQ
jgi:TetR/AcrR family transcriptional regulator, mexJK operon transcriptional repressor